MLMSKLIVPAAFVGRVLAQVHGVAISGRPGRPPKRTGASPEPTLEELLPPPDPNPFNSFLDQGELVPVPDHARFVLPSHDLYVQAMRMSGVR